MKAIDQFLIGRRRLRKDAEPAERIDSVVAAQDSFRKARSAYAVKAVATGDDVAFDFLRCAVMAKTNFRIGGLKIVDARIGYFEQNLAAVGEPFCDQVSDDFLLVVDEDLL